MMVSHSNHRSQTFRSCITNAGCIKRIICSQQTIQQNSCSGLNFSFIYNPKLVQTCKVTTEPGQSFYCHLLADKSTPPPLVHWGLETYTSASSFLFFSSFFSFSSSWVTLPFFTRSSFSLTWSSMLSTWEPTRYHTNAPCLEPIWKEDYIKEGYDNSFMENLPRTFLNILGPLSCALSTLIHLLDMALLKPTFPKESFCTATNTDQQWHQTSRITRVCAAHSVTPHHFFFFGFYCAC